MTDELQPAIELEIKDEEVGLVEFLENCTQEEYDEYQK